MDLKQHLIRAMAFSHATFGPGKRTRGVVEHVRKELREVIKGKGDAAEWVDVIILGLDGLTRELAYREGKRADPKEIAQLACELIEAKQTRNEGREWPDWRGRSPDKAIEHVRKGMEL